MNLTKPLRILAAGWKCHFERLVSRQRSCKCMFMEPITKSKYTSETELKYEETDVYPVPFIINKESVLDELERILQMFGGDFIVIRQIRCASVRQIR